MEYTFEGKKILLTGSGRGIGRGIASTLAAQGAKVYALDCHKDNLDDLVKENPTIIPIHQDITDWEQMKEVVSEIDDLDGLVNCAAVLNESSAAIDAKKEDIDRVIDVDLKAAINLMQVVGKKMSFNDRGGSIVNISSVGGTVAMKNLLAYCVAKAGLDMATKAFALELGPKKIRVNSVAPSAVKTKMFDTFMSESYKTKLISNTPIGRLNEIDDVAQSVLFLLSDRSKMATGSTMIVDGGHTCYLPV